MIEKTVTLFLVTSNICNQRENSKTELLRIRFHHPQHTHTCVCLSSSAGAAFFLFILKVNGVSPIRCVQMYKEPNSHSTKIP